MSTRVVCPECGDRLKLHKPAIDSTRVKCRNCGHKFYAGKAENWIDESQRVGGFHPLPGSTSSNSTATAVATADPMMEVEPATISEGGIEKKRHRHRIEESKTPRWAMPLGIVAVILIALAGIFLGQTPAVTEPPVTAKHTDPAQPKTEATPQDSLMASANSFRPSELIGIWETTDVPGGRLDFAADGTIHVHGAYLNEEQLDVVSRWFTIRMHGNDYVIEIGPEPKLTTNHGMRLVRQDDGSLVMTRYATVADLNVTERRFTKVK